MSEVIVVGESLHSKLGASSAHRWMKCPASIALAEKLGPSKTRKAGVAAKEGNAAHRVGEHCLDNGTDSWELAGNKIKVDTSTFDVDEEMVEGVQVYLDAVRAKLEKFPGAKLYVEESMASILHDDAFGTADAIVHVPGDRLIIFDFKYGRLIVEPDSLQNRYYGYLAVENIDDTVKVVELYIVQPRMPHPKGPVRRFVTNPEELTEWFTGEVVPAMEATSDPAANFEVGTHCRFCPARDACPALKGETFDFNFELDPEYLTSEEIGQLLERGDAISRYLQSLEQIALHRAMNGEKIWNRKLVRKKANRVLNDGAGEKAISKWGDDAYVDPKLKSPAQLEKLPGGKEWVSSNAHSPDMGLTLAPLSDKRTEVRPLRERINSA